MWEALCTIWFAADQDWGAVLHVKHGAFSGALDHLMLLRIKLKAGLLDAKEDLLKLLHQLGPGGGKDEHIVEVGHKGIQD